MFHSLVRLIAAAYSSEFIIVDLLY